MDLEIKTIMNKDNEKVIDEIQNEVEKNSDILLLTSYISIYAYNELKDVLSKAKDLNIIIKEPINIQGRKIDTNNIKKFIDGRKDELYLRNELEQKAIAKEFVQWLRKKCEIKILKNTDETPIIEYSGLYIKNEKYNAFFENLNRLDLVSLGVLKSNALTRVTLLKDIEDKELDSFNELFKNKNVTANIKKELIEYLEGMYKENTPSFLYFMTLYNIFKDYIDETTNNKYAKDNTSLTKSVIWNKLYKFQKDGVLGALEKLEKYNGCIIADSVGLGKTFEALAIIKYYESINARVLVLCPKKLRDNWMMYKGNDVRNILSEDRLRYDVLNHTDLTRKSGFSGDINLSTFNWSNYDLVVIDESHNFRNGGSRNSNNRYDKLMNDIIKMGIPTKVLLLSATPVNNQLNDLKHQINLITEENDKHIENEGIRSINFTLKSTQQAFNEWSKLPEEQRSLNEFLDLINYDYFKLLDIFTIARSRKHIEKYYTTNDIGKFSNRKKPITIKSKIDTLNKFPSISEIAKQISMLNLSAYSPVEYILPECLYKYKKYDFLDLDKNLSLKQSDREKGLLKLIRTNLLKRLESSIYSLQLTLERTLFRIDETINGLTESKEKFILNLELNESDIDTDDDSDEYIRKNSMEIKFKDIDIDRWINDLQEDKLIIQKLLLETNQINSSRDAKLKELKELLENKIKNPINDGNKKVIIFTAFADTATYLYENLEDWLISNYGLRSALIVGNGNNETNRANTRTDINEILMHFSPISKSRDSIQHESDLEIDVLIATDCISEGQNLQDCDYLVNYDIHWNPVRIIQRFGRIDRLGSKNEEIQLVNFWPNIDLEEYINLESRVKGRMELLNISATGEENILDEDNINEMNDLDFRKKQLQELQDRVIDIEDISGGISITDLTLNDFKMELIEFAKDKNNRRQLDLTPNGIYSIVSSKKIGSEIVTPGIIFCFKKIQEKNTIKEPNVLFPYYLVYIKENGEILYSHINSRKILDIYRKVAKEEKDLDYGLIENFNIVTNNNTDMNNERKLVEAALNSIIELKKNIGNKSIFNLGETCIPKDNENELKSYELISFLIIK